MPYLKLIELATRDVTEVRDDVARLGRSPECTVVLSGERAGVVSGVHAEIRHGVAGWLLIDLASLNGTFVNGRRLTGKGLLKAGDVIALGETGPRIAVAAVTEQTSTGAHYDRRTPPGGRAYAVTLLDSATGRRHEARGIRIRLGRGRECEVPLVDSSDRIVSRVHAELTVGPTGALVVRDVESGTGTFVNDERIKEPIPIRLGDRIMLGAGGPVLLVEGLGTSPEIRVPPAARGRKGVLARIRAAVAKLLPSSAPPNTTRSGR